MSLPTPGATATFKDVDNWLLDRVWTTTDPRRWEWRTHFKGKLTIATFAAAIKLQRSRDRRAGRKIRE